MKRKLDVQAVKRVDVGTEAVFALLDNAEGIAAWWQSSPMGMSVRKQSGPDSGPGLVVIFEAGGSAMETWTLKGVEPGERAVYDVNFAGMVTVERTIALAADGAGTRVTWRETAEVPDTMPEMPRDQLVQNFEMAIGLLGKAAAKTPRS